MTPLSVFVLVIAEFSLISTASAQGEKGAYCRSNTKGRAVDIWRRQCLAVEAIDLSCEVDPFSKNAPLLIKNGEESIIYPEWHEKKVKFLTGNVVEFSCPGKELMLAGQESGSIVKAKCHPGNIFIINGKQYHWKDIKCIGPTPTIKMKDGECSSNTRLVDIGFVLDNKRFLRTMEICFDIESKLALYSHFEMSSTISVHSDCRNRPAKNELDENLYGFNQIMVDNSYNIETERKTINSLLGLGMESQLYIKKEGGYYLAKGHLTACKDFVYTAEEFSTFRYINIVPQWQSFNNRNWKIFEYSTRQYADKNKVNLKIWTGTFRVSSLPNINNTNTDLYIYVQNSYQAIPVPALLWKLIYEPNSKKGVVLVGVNNIHLDRNSIAEYIICDDQSDSINWVNWKNKESRTAGYSYACTLTAFGAKVLYAPKLTDNGLLQ